LARARYFLETFATNPLEAKNFITKDAKMAVGDIGGPFNDYLKVLRRKPDWLAGCVVGQLEQKPIPSGEELKDAPPWMRGGKLSLIEGRYDCQSADGSKGGFRVSLVMRDDRVAMLALDRGR
jgi:hypothetical protein